MLKAMAWIKAMAVLWSLPAREKPRGKGMVKPTKRMTRPTIWRINDQRMMYYRI
jgi:hypothetical protein